MGNSYNNDLALHKRALNKVSFRSIIAGVIIAIIVQLLFSLLGIGLGLVNFTPTTDQNPFEGFGNSAIIWIIITTVISLFIGGWVSGWLATSTNKIDRILHGLLTWAIYTIISIFFVGSSITSVIGGIGNMISTTFSSNSQTVYVKDQRGSNDGNSSGGGFNISSEDLQNLKDEAIKTLRQTGKPELQPENLAQKGEKVVDKAKETAENIIKDPENADKELDGQLSKIFNNTEDVLSQVDKDAIVNVVASRTNKSKAESEEIVNNWINSVQNLKGNAKETAQNVKEDVKEVAQNVKEQAKIVSEDVTDSVGKFAIYLFIGLVLGALSSVFGSLFTKNKIRYDDTVN